MFKSDTVCCKTMNATIPITNCTYKEYGDGNVVLQVSSPYCKITPKKVIKDICMSKWQAYMLLVIHIHFLLLYTFIFVICFDLNHPSFIQEYSRFRDLFASTSECCVEKLLTHCSYPANHCHHQTKSKPDPTKLSQ